MSPEIEQLLQRVADASKNALAVIHGKESLGTNESLDVIYRQFDAWFRAGAFELANEALTQVPIQEESVLNLVGYLSATLPAKSELPYRSTFYQEVWKDFLHRPTTRDRIKRLLTGLE